MLAQEMQFSGLTWHIEVIKQLRTCRHVVAHGCWEDYRSSRPRMALNILHIRDELEVEVKKGAVRRSK